MGFAEDVTVGVVDPVVLEKMKFRKYSLPSRGSRTLYTSRYVVETSNRICRVLIGRKGVMVTS